MREAIDYLEDRPGCLDLVLKIQETLLAGVRGQELARGQLRKVQNWIGSPGCTMESVKFVPPDPVMLPEHVNNWEKYIHHEEQDRLVQLAVIHAQFEILHPFNDGNGRVGRMILPLVLYGYLLRRSDCYRLERPVAGWDFHSRKIAAFSRRTIFWSHALASRAKGSRITDNPRKRRTHPDNRGSTIEEFAVQSVCCWLYLPIAAETRPSNTPSA